MLLDIVILPPRMVGKNIVKKVQEAARNIDTIYIVDNKNLFHHLSLLHLRIRKSNLEVINRELKNILIKYKPCKISAIAVKARTRSVWALLSSRSKLKVINQMLLKYCAPLRSGNIPWTSIRKPTKGELKKIRLYGTKWCVGSTFIPHFTLARCKNKKEASLLAKHIGKMKFNFIGSTVAICEINLDGQVTRIVKRFRV